MFPAPAVHRRQMTGFLRSVPSPEQGTSHRTRSKRSGAAAAPSPTASGKRRASCEVTTSDGECSLAAREASSWQRLTSASLATRRPRASSRLRTGARAAASVFAIRAGAASISRICCAFEPGLAHISSTAMPGRTSSKSGGTIDTASCRCRLPRELSRSSHAWNALMDVERGAAAAAASGPSGPSPGRSLPRSHARETPNCQPSRSGYHGSDVGCSFSSGRRLCSMLARRLIARSSLPLKRQVTGRGERRHASKALHS
mmetsp:Transcript_32821/g.103050  ORF Transcript_32821/g.103050 Transcript_32821/m.103050 type:complete len:258 (-) Transcript_32821:177-950(-)